jgi:hypothetical protein
MTGRGYLFALDPDEVRLALACTTAADLGLLLEAFRADIRTAELDKAWLSIDRCLSGKPGPLSVALLGGRPVLRAAELVASLTPAEAVAEVARALEEVDEDRFRTCFEATLTGEPDGESDELDLLYAWGWFQRLRSLYRAASAERRAVLFAGELRPGAWRRSAAA